MLTSAQQLTLAENMEKWYVSVADYACKTSKGIKTKNNINCLEAQLQIIASLYNNMSIQDVVSFQYPIYEITGGGSYDMTGAYPNAFKININSTDYELGYIEDTPSFVDALNALGVGTFFYIGDTIYTTNSNQYGDITYSYAFYTPFLSAGFSLTRNICVDINDVQNNVGEQSPSTIVAALNGLSLGHWVSATIFNGFSLTVYGFNTYKKLQSKAATYDLTDMTFPSPSNSIVIDGVTHNLPNNINSFADLVTYGNALGLGIFSFDNGLKYLYVAGGFTYGTLTMTGGVSKTYNTKFAVSLITPVIHTGVASQYVFGEPFKSAQAQNGALTQANVNCLLAKLSEGVAEGTGKNVTPNYLMWGTDMVNDILDYGGSPNQHIKWRF